MKTFILLVLVSFCASAGCPAMGVQDVTVSLIACKDVKSPDGSLLDLSVISSSGRNMGMEVKAGEKVNAFMYPQEKLSCKALTVKDTYCLSFQRWCVMAGNPPHGVSTTLYGVRKGKCPASAQAQGPSVPDSRSEEKTGP